MNSKQRRQQRRKDIREVKERIANDEFDGVFTSHQYVVDSGFVDFLFIGEYKGKEVIWNACMTTADGDYYEKVDSLALDESYEKYPWPEGYQPFYSVPCEDHKGFSEMVDDPAFPDEVDRKVVRRKYHSKRTMEMLDAKSHPLERWNVEIDESYKWGVGLHIRVDVPHINTPDVIEFIKAFNEKGPEGVFADKDLTPVAKNAEELGVALANDGEWVVWKDHYSRDCVAIKLD